ncbi:MAG: exo-alpha-sialidase [Armatimonadetes bacterium]|nr:exo-alpha-sialidase [Armatimonadota bacterium]
MSYFDPDAIDGVLLYDVATERGGTITLGGTVTMRVPITRIVSASGPPAGPFMGAHPSDTSPGVWGIAGHLANITLIPGTALFGPLNLSPAVLPAGPNNAARYAVALKGMPGSGQATLFASCDTNTLSTHQHIDYAYIDVNGVGHNPTYTYTDIVEFSLGFQIYMTTQERFFSLSRDTGGYYDTPTAITAAAGDVSTSASIAPPAASAQASAYPPVDPTLTPVPSVVGSTQVLWYQSDGTTPDQTYNPLATVTAQLSLKNDNAPAVGFDKIKNVSICAGGVRSTWGGTTYTVEGTGEAEQDWPANVYDHNNVYSAQYFGVGSTTFAPRNLNTASVNEYWFDGSPVPKTTTFQPPAIGGQPAPPPVTNFAVQDMVRLYNTEVAKFGSRVAFTVSGQAFGYLWGRNGWTPIPQTSGTSAGGVPTLLGFHFERIVPMLSAINHGWVNQGTDPVPGRVLGTLTGTRTPLTLPGGLTLAVQSGPSDSAGKSATLTQALGNWAGQRWLTLTLTASPAGTGATLTVQQANGGSNTYTLRPDAGGNCVVDLAFPDSQTMPAWGVGIGLLSLTPNYTDDGNVNGAEIARPPSPNAGQVDYGSGYPDRMLYGYSHLAGDAAQQAAQAAVSALTLTVAGPSQSVGISGLAFGADKLGMEAWVCPLAAQSGHAGQLREVDQNQASGGQNLAFFQEKAYYAGRLQLLVDGKPAGAYPFSAGGIRPVAKAGSGWTFIGTITAPPMLADFLADMAADDGGATWAYQQTFTPPGGGLTTAIIPLGMLEDPHFPCGASAARPWVGGSQALPVARRMQSITFPAYSRRYSQGVTVVYGAGVEGLAYDPVRHTPYAGGLTVRHSLTALGLAASVSVTPDALTGFWRAVAFETDEDTGGGQGDRPTIAAVPSAGSPGSAPGAMAATAPLLERAYTETVFLPPRPLGRVFLTQDAHLRPAGASADTTGALTLLSSRDGRTFDRYPVSVAGTASDPTLLISPGTNRHRIVYAQGTPAGAPLPVAQVTALPDGEGAGDWQPPQVVTLGGSALTARYPVAAQHPHEPGHVLMAYLDGAGNLQAARSTDGGATFAALGTVDAGLDFSASGRAALAWQGNTAVIAYQKGGDLVARRSGDGGTTWGAPQTVATGTAGGLQAQAHGGQVFVAGTLDTGGGPTPAVWVSGDGAASWAALTPPPGASSGAALGAQPRTARLFYTTDYLSADGGHTWQSAG